LLKLSLHPSCIFPLEKEKKIMNITMDAVQTRTDTVTTEGDILYYEVRGRGKPLLMIPGGGGDSRIFSPIADILSNDFKVITYDRRGNARSTRHVPQNFEVNQQSRDAVAVLHAADENSAFIMGSSSGAVIALDMAKTQAQSVRAIIAHEPPLAQLHPQARKWQRFFASVHQSAFRFGSQIAMVQFVFGVGLPIWNLLRAGAKEIQSREMQGGNHAPLEMAEFFIKGELLPVTNYLPDIDTLKKDKARIFLAAGEESLRKRRFYAETAPILAGLLSCEMVTFPGHHVSYVDRPASWAAVLRDTLQNVEQQITLY